MENGQLVSEEKAILCAKLSNPLYKGAYRQNL